MTGTIVITFLGVGVVNVGTSAFLTEMDYFWFAVYI
jgi:hypothetical protein